MNETSAHQTAPGVLPLFSLSGVILLPRAHLPLRLFEPHTVAMIDHALCNGRIIGIVQPMVENSDEKRPPLFQVGCAGRIVSFSETEDGRYLINLMGLARFKIANELPELNGFRRIEPDWSPFINDKDDTEKAAYDTERLTQILRTYFDLFGVSADWGIIQSTPPEELISTLAMICPLAASEKQALLEAPDLQNRAETLMTLLEMACLRSSDDAGAKH